MKRVPRYTSYPTAPHFHSGVDEKKYKSWLSSLKKDKKVSLYFHIPFCKQLCSFCGCHTKIVNNYNPIKKYLELLEQEATIIAHYIKENMIDHIHFGGGSPTILSAEDFTNFMGILRKTFNITKNTEIAVEMDPRTIDSDRIISYKQTGITRASLGVQDFNLKVQEAINRVQSYEMIQNVVKELRENGINSLNIDLIYGLPHQTLKTIKETIERTLTLDPNRISLFGYAHVPWMKKHQQLIPEDTLPNKESRIAMFELSKTLLLQAGYVYIGLDHFTKPNDSMAIAAQEGTLQRNFQGYTTDNSDMLIGLGVSSISSLPQGYVQNTSQNIDYKNSIQSRALPIIRGVEFTADDIERHNIIMSLMCNLHAKIPQHQYSKEITQLKPYIDSGKVSYINDTLTINQSARNELRIIASIFDNYLSNTEHRYSQAQ